MKKDYLTRLERWARWRLPPQEAADVMADYRDIVGASPRSEEELLQSLGKPRDVIRPLTQPRPYRIWLAQFLAMAACVLLPAVSPLPLGPYPVWFSLFDPYGFLIPGVSLFLWFMVLGTALVLVCFRPRRGEPREPLPRAALVTLLIELALMAVVWWLLWQLSLYPEGFFAAGGLTWALPFMVRIEPYTYAGNWCALLLEWGGAAVGLVGAAALVKARTSSRRWRAVYPASMTLMMLSFRLLSAFTSMDFSSNPLESALPAMIQITVIGLVGMGVSLC